MPSGCDTFVILPPNTADGWIVFGKNSDRPNGEVQEIVYFPSKQYCPGTMLECTYISIPQVAETREVILSKPGWMWGAEMGANDAGVVVGNEAVFTRVADSPAERLLGMDLVRLCLERSKTASEGVYVITSLLEAHGQGGPCSDTNPSLSYHNSFLIADPTEAWVVETAGRIWAATKVKNGYRHISNSLSLTVDLDLMSRQCIDYAIENQLWHGRGAFNFKDIYMLGGDCARLKDGAELINQAIMNKDVTESHMFKILRDTPSEICRPKTHAFPTASSQVSVLRKNKPCTHWFTGTPDPSKSVFKPFIFSNRVDFSDETVCPVFNPDPAKAIPRFSFTVDRRHLLYSLHDIAVNFKPDVIELLKHFENDLVCNQKHFIQNYQPGQEYTKYSLFHDAVDTEVKYYGRRNLKRMVTFARDVPAGPCNSLASALPSMTSPPTSESSIRSDLQFDEANLPTFTKTFVPPTDVKYSNEENNVGPRPQSDRTSPTSLRSGGGFTLFKRRVLPDPVPDYHPASLTNQLGGTCSVSPVQSEDIIPEHLYYRLIARSESVLNSPQGTHPKSRSTSENLNPNSDSQPSTSR